MSDFGVIFCGKCDSLKVDSGFDTDSTLKCVDCKNEVVFKVGKVGISSEKSTNLDQIITMAKKDAHN